MFFVWITGFFIAMASAQLLPEETCDMTDLRKCIQKIPRTSIGLPRNKEELDARCLAYQTGMSCMDPWMKRCLPTDGQKIIQQQIGGARALMRFLCANDTAMRRDFLREPTCWAMISPDWSRCSDEIQQTLSDISERSQHITYLKRNAERCCARDEFILCVAHAGRPCSAAASNLLRKMAWVLAQDIATCSQIPRAYCSAPHSHLAAPLLTALSGVLLFPLRI